MINDKKDYTGQEVVQTSSDVQKKENVKVVVTKDGPYLVTGGLPLAKEIIVTDDHGVPLEWSKGEEFPVQETYALCRCGQSKNKPYCDGTHTETGFNGTESASGKKYLELANKIPGPGVDLTDAPELCAMARFCHRAGGIWDLVKFTDDPEIRELAIKIAGNCPSGRLVMWDKTTGKPIEPKFVPSVSLVEGPKEEALGPIWLKGGIPFESSEGFKYETRNRVTLCRCGRSGNKPYCDGTHTHKDYVKEIKDLIHKIF
ncbi:iron-binding protein [Methanocella sp. CWC-04]|uniref:Iron-binding protein n=1 Tax=Methanooceanicella nereidis TaxID=2052831 RepID=A0AAP2RCS7_9EURY|nr:CDGSH iron-sulfur domain-containing protein [Methanocella sp. CWC-04]MCD1295038.1 iron-binding protein [Methanocella sp. CWC-04]